MADLFVLGFPMREKAEAVLEVTRDLQKQELLDLEDGALVWRTADGKIKVQQSYSPAATAAAGGALWGLLFGLLFTVPVFAWQWAQPAARSPASSPTSASTTSS
jgi:uncharacterized membrane protein